MIVPEDNRYYHFTNLNPKGKNVKDCVYRSLCAFLDVSWEDACRMNAKWFLKTGSRLEAEGIVKFLMEEYSLVPKAFYDNAWKGYLSEAVNVPPELKVISNIQDFIDNVAETDVRYLFCVPQHVLTVRDKKVWDTWDSSRACPDLVFELRK